MRRMSSLSMWIPVVSLLLLLAIVLVPACAQPATTPAPTTAPVAKPAPTSTAAPAPTSTAAPSPKPSPTSTAPAPTTPAQVLTIRYSHTFAATDESPKHIFATKFQALCDQLFPGRVKFQEFPAAQLYSNADGIKATTNGAVEMAVADTSYMEPQCPNIGLTRLPGLDKCPAHVQDFWTQYADEFSKRYLNDKFNVGIKIMHPTDSVTWWFKKPYKSLADIKGVKTGQSPGEMARVLSEGLGMTPVICDMAERVTALQTGMITGCAATSFTTAYTNTVHKYATYAFPPSLCPFYGSHHIYYNYKWFTNLPPDFRDKLVSVIWPQAIDAAYQFQAQFAGRVLDTVQKEGATLLDLTPADHDKVLNEIYPAVAKQFLSTANQWELDALAKVGQKYERGASFVLKP